MRKAAKIWLWCALALSVATTLLNAFSGRMLSVVIALAALAGLCILLFTERKAGYLFMCVCYLCSFINGLISGFTTDTNLAAAIIMSFIGSALIPVITYLFLRKDWQKLK
ncbi:hypothetical protein [Dielma fastidiosa]|uniref:hypothetical protein n=1 Tax=Dielma fastidiosa TaxID=1034346 RepID=UPI000EC44CC9|nr:hypothetical protein [Dielma fastidiosa]HAH94232.1 hypothetical protein [Dielma fastidiosa]